MKDKKCEAHVKIGSHFIHFYEMSQRFRDTIRLFIQQRLVGKIVAKVQGRWVTERGKVYAAFTPGKTGVTLHINLKEDVMQFLNNTGIKQDKLKIEELGFEDYPVAKSGYKLLSHFKMRDEQQMIIDESLKEGHRKIISLSMGMGKTATSLKLAEIIGQRFCVMVLPKYKDKWIEDFVDYGENVKTVIEDTGKRGRKKEKIEKLLVLDTLNKFVDYLDWISEHPGEDDDDVWCIIVTITVVMGYLNYYNEQLVLGQADNLVHPTDIWSTMRVGFRITDENHEHFHRNFVIDLHTHIPKTVYLSATLDPTGSFEEKMYEIMFPDRERMGREFYKPYVNVIEAVYSHYDPNKYRCVVRGMYSHATYETSFVQNTPFSKKRQKAYFDMIYKLLEIYYFKKKRNDKQKAIVFFSLIDTCTAFVSYLKKKLPGVDIRRYVGEDDYENIMSAQIAVSTPGSAGTAIDIKGLICNIMTINMKSRQANLQIMGRTRPIVDVEGQHPYFVYLKATDIPKFNEYAGYKRALLKNMTLSINEFYTNVELP